LQKGLHIMPQIKHYNTLDDVLSFFLTILSEAKPDRVASISKYARVNNEEIKVQAIKRKDASGFTWNLEITVDFAI